MYRKMRLRIGHISYCEFTFPHLVFPSYTLPDVASVAPQFNSSPHIEIHDPRIFLLELMIDPQIGHSAVASGGRAFHNYNYPAFVRRLTHARSRRLPFHSRQRLIFLIRQKPLNTTVNPRSSLDRRFGGTSIARKRDRKYETIHNTSTRELRFHCLIQCSMVGQSIGFG
jgi:hypothetical protein